MTNCGFYYSNPYVQNKGTMKINGVGTLKVDPDSAAVNLGVITENISLEKAQKENTVKSTAVINKLFEMGIPKNHIRTVYYNIEPQYDYVEGKQIFRGYRVINILAVTIKDLTKIGEIIDAATLSGANSVDKITFTLDNPSKYYNEALKLAIRNAVHKAMEMSQSLKVQVYETPYKITEENYTATVQESSLMKFSSPTTPVLPGEMSVNARIEAIFYYYK